MRDCVGFVLFLSYFVKLFCTLVYCFFFPSSLIFVENLDKKKTCKNLVLSFTFVLSD
jgi:hypothetical protein